MTGDFCCFWFDVAGESAAVFARFIGDSVDADIDYGRAGLDPVSLDSTRATDCSDDEVGAATNVCNIFGA